MPKKSINDPASSPEIRGKRLKTLRKLADLTREDIAQHYEISSSTLRSWEDGRATGLTEQGARRIIAAFKNEGIQCSIGWLLYGKGNPPSIENAVLQTPKIPLVNKKTEIMSELNYFINRHSNATYCIIQDDAMEPFFFKGDYTAGNQRYADAIEELVGQHCIVETKSGEKHVRLLRKGSKPNHYHLLCLNPKTTVELPTLYNVSLVSAAPVIWWRKEDDFDLI